METTTRTNSADKIDIVSVLYDVGKGLRRYFVLILAAMSLAATICYQMSMRSYVPRYTSTATVIINLKSAVHYNESFSPYYTQSATQQITKTFPYITASGALRNRITNEFGAAAADATIRATEMEGLNMLSLGVTAGRPELAYNILQSVLENYTSIAELVIGDTEITVVTPAQMPTRADNPSEPLSLARRGVLAVAAAAIVLLLFRSSLKKTVRSEEDFRRYFSLASLGGLPHVRSKRTKDGSGKLLRVDGIAATYGYKEAVRTLRSRLERDHADHGSKVFMVTSALAGEGKSTVSANIAISLAEKGYRVLLVDMDLRNSSITEVMGLSQEETGLADLLEGKASVGDIMLVDEKSGVAVLPGGNAGKKAVQLLSSDRPRRLLAMAREEVDFIIVDTPPIGILSDAASIVQNVDAGIFVIRQDYAPVDRILEGIQMLSETGLRIVGCVLNNMDTGVVGGYGHYSRYGYGRYGGYGYGRYGHYGYGYGYGSKNKKRSRKNASDDEDDDAADAQTEASEEKK